MLFIKFGVFFILNMFVMLIVLLIVIDIGIFFLNKSLYIVIFISLSLIMGSLLSG